MRDRIVQQLQERSPVPIRKLVLPKSIETLYTTIETELGEEQPPALMVLGLESVKELDRVLIATNYVRQDFYPQILRPSQVYSCYLLSPKWGKNLSISYHKLSQPP